jgi:hypothetical protein
MEDDPSQSKFGERKTVNAFRSQSTIEFKRLQLACYLIGRDFFLKKFSLSAPEATPRGEVPQSSSLWERVCSLLVLNSVTSTPQWIRCCLLLEDPFTTLFAWGRGRVQDMYQCYEIMVTKSEACVD